MVPKPLEREKLVLYIYKKLEYFGMKSIYNLLQNQYWWNGMQIDVPQIVAKCQMCDKICASFNALLVVLQPLPFMNLEYWCNLDFVGPLLMTKNIRSMYW